jgi:hypothetical protein
MAGISRSITIESRLLEKRSIDSKTNCWEWEGVIMENGYGQIHYLGKLMYVHRVAAHVWLKFDLDSGLKVLHKCDNRRCFNPEHLVIGTQTQNQQDMASKGRCNFSKLTPEQVAEIRKLHSEGVPISKIKDLFPVSWATVSSIVKGRCWKDPFKP